MGEKNHTLELLAAVMAGDCWLSADACALHLGMTTPDGSVNRRGFLERIACLPDFPPQNPKTRSWRKSAVDKWAEEQARANRAA